MKPRIFFHTGAPCNGCPGIGDHWRTLDAAGIPFGVYSVEGAGLIAEAAQLAHADPTLFPSMTGNNVSDCAFANPELFCQSANRCAAASVQASNLRNLTLRKLGAIVRLSAFRHELSKMLRGVAHVFCVGNVLKVLYPIVSFIKIFVVNLKSIRGDANKSLGHHFMHFLYLLASLCAEIYTDIAIFVFTWFKRGPQLSVNPACNSHYTPITANLIPSFPTNNISPFFFGHEKISYGKPQEIGYTHLCDRPNRSPRSGMFIASPGHFFCLNYTTNGGYANGL